MATAVWTVPARLTSALATLLSKQTDQDEDLYDVRLGAYPADPFGSN